jgi:hypothetical protein
MGPDASVGRLAQELLRRRFDGVGLPALVLGSEFARSAGMPPFSEIAARILREPVGDAPAMAPPHGLEAAFLGFLEGLGAPDRLALATQASDAVPIPEAAQELALLARDGFFGAILTTSFDSLVERALESAGLVYDRDFAVFDLLDGPPPPSRQRQLAVLKAYSPSGIRRSDELGSLVDEIAVVIGSGSDDPDLELLTYQGGDVWWFGTVEPHQALRDALLRSRSHVYVVSGPTRTPDRFFGELSLRLQQLPSLNLLEQSRRPDRMMVSPVRKSQSGSVRALLGVTGGTEVPDGFEDEDFERLLASTRLQRARDEIRRLERLGAGTGTDRVLDIQLEYELNECLLLEAELRAMKGTRDQLLGLLDQIRTSSADLPDRSTADYLNTLVDRIDEEYRDPNPNQRIVGATIGAVSALADLVGIEPNLVRQLSAYTPTVERAKS